MLIDGIRIKVLFLYILTIKFSLLLQWLQGEFLYFVFNNEWLCRIEEQKARVKGRTEEFDNDENV